jgi:hypothetical protein
MKQIQREIARDSGAQRMREGGCEWRAAPRSPITVSADSEVEANRIPIGTVQNLKGGLQAPAPRVKRYYMHKISLPNRGGGTSYKLRTNSEYSSRK